MKLRSVTKFSAVAVRGPVLRARSRVIGFPRRVRVVFVIVVVVSEGGMRIQIIVVCIVFIIIFFFSLVAVVIFVITINAASFFGFFVCFALRASIVVDF